jgi:hypothetical protein
MWCRLVTSNTDLGEGCRESVGRTRHYLYNPHFFKLRFFASLYKLNGPGSTTPAYRCHITYIVVNRRLYGTTAENLILGNERFNKNDKETPSDSVWIGYDRLFPIRACSGR